MKRFDYIRPASVADAVAAAANPGSVYLAAGTNLLDLMKINVTRPERVIDISRLPGLDRIEWLDDGGMRIGAMVRNADLAYDTRFAAAYPAVAEALLSGASAQLRNAATVGGNLMQRTRCAYFQDTDSACNRREPGSGCDALKGENRLHAVLGWTEQCIATHPSDFCVPLAALGAMIEVTGAGGPRDIPIEHLHSLPNEAAAPEWSLLPGDIVTGLRLPNALAFAGHARYLKLRERTSYAFAVVSAAALLDMDGGVIREARLSLGAVAAKPWRAKAAEAALAGQTPSPDLFEEVARIALSEARPSGDNAFKITLAGRILVRALTLASQGTPAVMPALPASPTRTVSSSASAGETHVA